MDWALSAEAQEIPWREERMYQIPTNIYAKASPNSVDPKTLHLINLILIVLVRMKKASV